MPPPNRYPRIFLALDNCFASKRWTLPADWMSIARDVGIFYVEASADTECDPLYHGADYLADWVTAVRTASAETGVRVVNLYSGHGTYATLGLAHTDARVRARFLNNWLLPLADMAAELEAGMGFFCHAFDESVLRTPDRYGEAEARLFDSLAQFALLSARAGAAPVGVEQMYTPHQIPWTIAGGKKLLREVYRRSGGAPFYLTLDTGHQTSQALFPRPTSPQIAAFVLQQRGGNRVPDIWLGNESCRNAVKAAAHHPESPERAADRIGDILSERDYLFSGEEDSSPSRWNSSLGCYSPIVHLQQTTAGKSAHLPFTPEANQSGIVSAEDVLRALRASYETAIEAGMPPRCETIYLTLELFFGTAARSDDILRNLAASVAYWRKWAPRDGMRLDEIIA